MLNWSSRITDRLAKATVKTILDVIMILPSELPRSPTTILQACKCEFTINMLCSKISTIKDLMESLK